MPDGVMLLASRYGSIFRIDADGRDPRVMMDLVVAGEPTGSAGNSTLGIIGMALSHDFADDRTL